MIKMHATGVRSPLLKRHDTTVMVGAPIVGQEFAPLVPQD